MIQSMYNGVSGLRAHKTQMDVIGNNIANINTIGFKASRVSFREMLSQTISGATAPTPGGAGGTNPVQIGLGTSVGSIDVSQIQGSLLPTGKPTDVAVEGNGFIVLGDGQGRYYTRDGSFQLDAEGNLVSSGSGFRVLGWMADPFTGVIDNSLPVTPSSGLKLPLGQLAIARQTTCAEYGGNLDMSAPVDGTYSVRSEIQDSLGASHSVTITFTKTANDGEWTWEASSPDADPLTSVGSGTIQFDSNGKNIMPTGQMSLTLASSNGAVNPILVNLSFASITQYDGSYEGTYGDVKSTYGDGLTMGTLDSFTIGKDGVISGQFTNGMQQRLGQIALAQFSNPSGLSKIGTNMLAESGNSGLPQVGQPASSSFGKITSGFLESSNVDLPTEFANMIIAQRGFQANSRIITTSDEILQELVQLKR